MLNKKGTVKITVLKKIRQEKGLKQNELAKKSKVSIRALQNYERNERVPDVRTAIRIAEVFEIKDFTDFKELFKLPSENSSSEKQITTK